MVAQGESIILEEDIDENYEPTEEEILEYAKFLGMDLEKDKDLFYIAKEGLKAPLPEPWKPCQTREGEIYYFNFETGKSTWDHPCDDYYKKMYEKEKQKKLERQNGSQNSKKANTTAAKNTGSKKSSKDPALALENLPKLGNVGKKDDPLLKAAHEKKAKQYREQREKEIQQQLEHIRLEGENRRKEIEKQHQKKLKEIAAEYEKKQAAEEERIKRENKPLDEKEIPAEVKKQEVELRRELEKNFSRRLKVLDIELNTKVSEASEKFNKIKLQKLNQVNSQIEKEYKEELQRIEKEIDKLKKQKTSMVGEDPEVMEQNMKKKILSEKESAFQVSRENMMKEVQEETEKLKKNIIQKQTEEISALYKKFESEKGSKEDDVDPEYKAQLERELKEKVEDYKMQIDKKIEIMQMEVEERLLEQQRAKIAASKEKMHGDLAYLEQNYEKTKENFDSDFQKEKARLQKKNDDEIATLRKLSQEQIAAKKKNLEKEQLDKISKLRMQLELAKDSDPKLKERLFQVEEMLTKAQKTLKTKQEEYSKECLMTESLEKDIHLTESRQKTELDATKKILGVAGDLESELDVLTKVLREKEAKVEELKFSRSAHHHRDPQMDLIKSYGTVKSIDYSEQKAENNEFEDQLESPDLKIDKLQFEVRNLKDFLQSHLSGITSPGQSEKNRLMQKVESDKKRLLEKREKILKNKKIVEQDLHSFEQEPERVAFLQDMREMLKKKLIHSNSQIDYLKNVEKKALREEEYEKPGRRMVPRTKPFKTDLSDRLMSSLTSDDIKEQYDDFLK